MRPLVTTVRAIRELATGLSPDAVASTPVLFQFDTPRAEYLLSADDGLDAQRILIMRNKNVRERYVPEHLADARRVVLSRMASFSERARIRPLSLPRGWHQYKYNNLVAFFVVPGADAQSTRWIVEVLPGDRADVVFWRATTSGNEGNLADFDAAKPQVFPELETEWAQAIEAGRQRFAEDRRPDSIDVDMYLSALTPAQARGWSYEQWLDKVSDDQRAFIDAPTDRSSRLRGPAGSGKTLAIALKAVREVLGARDQSASFQVMIVTHSWALAAQISDSIDSMMLGYMRELSVFPLLEVARSISPGYLHDTAGFSVIGDDSLSGKQAQLDQIHELLDEFIATDWITYRTGVSEALRVRFDSSSEEDRKALAWDMLIEFGSVIGAAAIFPGVGSELRYFQLQRARWMLPLNSRGDLRVVFLLYCRYMENLEARSQVTSDQVLADFLSHLETHAWNRSRKTDGYDLLFVDEFHLFNPLERQILHYLTRDVTSYPKIFMAVDPRQSPSEAFIGVAADGTRSSTSGSPYEGLGDIANFELTTVHRFTPQVLGLITHIHHEFPTFNLGDAWDIDFSSVDSAQNDGPLPRLVSSASRAAEEIDIYRAVQQVYSNGRVALAIVDPRQWRRYSELGSHIDQAAKFHVASIAGRSDIEGLGYRRRGLVVGAAEYLAGLQFETVLVAGIPDLQGSFMTANEKTRMLSLLYLAVSRAERDVRVFVNDDDHGAPEVLLRAVSNGLMELEHGSLT